MKDQANSYYRGSVAAFAAGGALGAVGVGMLTYHLINKPKEGEEVGVKLEADGKCHADGNTLPILGGGRKTNRSEGANGSRVTKRVQRFSYTDASEISIGGNGKL